MTHKRSQYHGSIRAIWGLAKSPELDMDDEMLYALILNETGKDSMKSLVQGEIDHICRLLQNEKNKRMIKSKRTDEGGNEDTVKLRKKIYILTGQLGWNDDNKRINGFVKKMFKVNRLEWLDVSQCHKLIEILKKMMEREVEEKANGSKEQAADGHNT